MKNRGPYGTLGLELLLHLLELLLLKLLLMLASHGLLLGLQALLPGCQLGLECHILLLRLLVDGRVDLVHLHRQICTTYRDTENDKDATEYFLVLTDLA